MREEFIPLVSEDRRLNARPDRPGTGMTLRRFRSLAGLAAAIIPCAILVHLVAEGAALGVSGLDGGFVVRHAYFGGLFLGAAWWFGSTVGLGRCATERRRRCALLRAELDIERRPHHVLLLLGANLGFFACTQALEGCPVASGAVALGLSVALAGSLFAALVAFVFGQAIVAAGLEAIIGCAQAERVARVITRRSRNIVCSRRARAAYSLFVPNRPPPSLSPSCR